MCWMDFYKKLYQKVLNVTETQFRNIENVFICLFLYEESHTSTIPTTRGEKSLPNICIID